MGYSDFTRAKSAGCVHSGANAGFLTLRKNTALSASRTGAFESEKIVSSPANAVAISIPSPHAAGWHTRC